MKTDSRVRSVASANSSAVDLVTAEIRRAVLTGSLPAGEEFSIRDLAAQLGVSHIPIREALRRLESQGLVILPQARSARVASLSSGDLKAIYKLRYAVEVPLAGSSASIRTPDQIIELATCLEQTKDSDPEAAWQAHYDFHAALVQPAATAWDERILETLWVAAERYTHLVFDPTEITQDERERRYTSHRELFDAAISGNPEAIANALRDHLCTNETLTLSHITAIEQAEPPVSAP